jgi:hypothetical protein
MEQDEGNANAFKDKIKGVVAIAALGLEANGIPVPNIAEELIGDIANAVVGSGDDLIAQVARSFTGFQVIEEARKARQQERDVHFTFLTQHRGGGATYNVCFDIEERL